MAQRTYTTSDELVDVLMNHIQPDLTYLYATTDNTEDVLELLNYTLISVGDTIDHSDETVAVSLAYIIDYYGWNLDGTEKSSGSGQSAEILMRPDTYDLNSGSLTIPTKIGLRFQSGAVISNGTLTINGPIYAGAHNIFAESLTVAGSPSAAYILPDWFASSGDDTNPLNKALSLRQNVLLYPREYTTSDTVKVYPGQVLSGMMRETSMITSSVAGTSSTAGSVDWKPAVALALDDGDISLTTAGDISDISLRDLTIKCTGAHSVALQVAGVFESPFRNLTLKTDESEAAGSRTGCGLLITGKDTVSIPRGSYYSDFSDFRIRGFGIGILYGNRTHQESPLRNMRVSYCDTALLQDDGTHLGYTQISAPAMMSIHGGAYEVIHNNVFDNLISDRVAIRDAYVDSIGGYVYVLNGANLLIDHCREVSLTLSDAIQRNSGTVEVSGYARPEVFTAIEQFNNRVTQNRQCVGISRAFSSKTATSVISIPSQIIGHSILTGVDASTITLAVVFSDYVDGTDGFALPTSLVINAIDLRVVSSSAGGASNSKYLVAASDVTLYASNTGFSIRLRTYDDSVISAGATVTVQWSILTSVV